MTVDVNCHRQTVQYVPNKCNTLIQITENMREIPSNTALTKDLNKQTEDGSFKTTIGMVSTATRKDFLVFISSQSFAMISDSQ